MGDLSRNLSRHEFACKCGCGFDTVDEGLIPPLQAVVFHFEEEDHADMSIIITSGNRCKKYNDDLRELFKRTKGKQGALTAKGSQHIFARAVDFHIINKVTGDRINPDRVADYFVKYWPDISVGRYLNRTHIDNRTGIPVYWDSRRKS